LAKLSEREILGALSRVIDPDLNRDIVSLGYVANLKSEDGSVAFDLELLSPTHPARDKLTQRCREVLEGLGIEKVTVSISPRPKSVPVRNKQMIPGIRNIIAVASGKGGVGKSTIAVNLALALAQAGAETGLLDCDFYGPSVPAQVGIADRVAVNEKQQMIPHRVHGLAVMSMGFLVERGQAIVWRGPMLHKVLTQMLFQVDWGGLDYLILDLPPGTGDVQLSLAQSVPVSASVLVTTPQEVALRDVEKGLRMFQSVDIPVLGIVENMSYYLCRNCDKKHEIFGSGGAERVARAHNLPVMGRIPLDPRIQGKPGSGAPLMVREPDSPAARAYRETAGAVVGGISKLVSSWASPGPSAMEV